MVGRAIARATARTGAAILILSGLPSAASAQLPTTLERRLAELEAELKDQRSLIQDQARRIEDQQRQIEKMHQEMLLPTELANARGAGALAQDGAVPARSAEAQLPSSPVGEAPDLPAVESQVEAVPQGQGVLTPAGRLVFDPSIEYTNSSNNRLVFRGIELIPGIQIGVIEASDADRDTIAATAMFRYGLTDRLEVELRVPYLVRSDRIEVVQQREGTIVREIELKERGFGDVEFAGRYQLNRPVGQKPIFVASLRVKSDTGKSPFEVPFDDFGVATGLATGSGFWGFQPGMNFLLPSDPAVIFGGVAYLYHMPKNVNRMVGDVLVGRVDPGDAITANLGFGFALNPRFSYSLGYRHSYIFPTKTELGDSTQRRRARRKNRLEPHHHCWRRRTARWSDQGGDCRRAAAEVVLLPDHRAERYFPPAHHAHAVISTALTRQPDFGGTRRNCQLSCKSRREA
jgi:uncharacterized coiled-coil protein SlyX